MREISENEIAEEFLLPKKILKEISPKLYEEFARTYEVNISTPPIKKHC